MDVSYYKLFCFCHVSYSLILCATLKRLSKLSTLDRLFLGDNSLNETTLPYLGTIESVVVLKLEINVFISVACY